MELIGKNGPAEAIGAKVIIHSGGKKQVLINQRANGYLSYNDPRIHIGLGQVKEIDLIEIIWADGKKESYQIPGIDQYLTIKQKTGILKN